MNRLCTCCIGAMRPCTAERAACRWAGATASRRAGCASLGRGDREPPDRLRAVGPGRPRAAGQAARSLGRTWILFRGCVAPVGRLIRFSGCAVFSSELLQPASNAVFAHPRRHFAPGCENLPSELAARISHVVFAHPGPAAASGCADSPSEFARRISRAVFAHPRPSIGLRCAVFSSEFGVAELPCGFCTSVAPLCLWM